MVAYLARVHARSNERAKGLSMRIDLDERLPAWQEAGIITPDQAGRIRALEATGDGDSRLSLVVEALGYLGATLALVAGWLVVADVWEQLAATGRIAIVAAATLGVFIAGAVVRDNRSPAVQRLVSLLWAVAVAGAAFLTGLIATEWTGLVEETIGLTVGIVTTIVGGALYLIRRRTLQQIGFGAGVLMTVVFLMMLPEADLSAFWAGLVVWALGGAWAVLGWANLLPPRATAEVVGIVTAGIALNVAASDELRAVALLIGLASAALLIVASVAERRTLYLGFGAAGVFVFVPQLVFEWFADTIGAPVALFVTGLLLVVAAVGTARLKGEVIDRTGAAS
jgi:hypothetical protein